MGAPGAKLALPRHHLWRSVVHGFTILICGTAIGGAATVHFLHRHLQYAIHYPESFPVHVASTLRANLDLSDQQTTQVESIVRQRQEEIRKIRLRFQPEFEAQLDAIETDIAAVLIPRQSVQWHNWLAEKRRTWLPPLPKPTTAPRP